MEVCLNVACRLCLALLLSCSPPTACLHISFTCMRTQLGLIASIVIPGAVFLIPALCTSPTALVLDHGAAMLLTFLVVFNFFACECVRDACKHG